jgi:hypothetical protein
MQSIKMLNCATPPEHREKKKKTAPTAMAQDGCQPPAWTGQAFPFLHNRLVAGALL